MSAPFFALGTGSNDQIMVHIANVPTSIYLIGVKIFLLRSKWYLDGTSHKGNFLGNWHTILSLDWPTETYNLNQIAFD